MLKLSKMTDYGVVVMGYMASRRDDVVPATEIAEATGLAAPTVSQVMKTLASSGLATSQRGAHGGYTLARGPSEITMAEIVTAFEGPVALTACVEGSPNACDVESQCLLRGSWDRVNEAISTALGSVTLAEILTPITMFGIDPSEPRRERPAAEV